jgi:hypothetical protein
MHRSARSASEVGGAGPANSFSAGHLTILRSSSGRTACKMSEIQPAGFPLHFAETGDLRSAAEKLGQAVEREVELVPAGFTTTLKYFDYKNAIYRDTVQKYEIFYQNVGSFLSHFTRY